MDAYRAIVDKRDQRIFLDRPVPEDALARMLQAARMTGSSKNVEPNRTASAPAPLTCPSPGWRGFLGIPDGLAINRVIGFGYVDPARAAAPPSVRRKRLPLSDLTHWEIW